MSKMDTWFRKHDPRRKPDPNELFLFKGGYVTVVIRPEDPARKLATVENIPLGTSHEAAQVMLQAALDEQPHKFIGYGARKPVGAILDKWGTQVDTVQPGDSWVTGECFEPPMFMRTGRMHDEVWAGRRVLVLPRPDLALDSNTGIVMGGPDAAAIVLRGGVSEPDCHIPTLNRIITGDPNKDYREVLHAT